MEFAPSEIEPSLPALGPGRFAPSDQAPEAAVKLSR